MYVKAIKWIDKEAKEAEVTVSDNSIDLVCFSYPCRYSIGDKIDDYIHCLSACDIVEALDSLPLARKSREPFQYWIRGKLIDRTETLMLVGSIMISLEDVYLPKDIMEGKFIELKISRLDLY